MAQAQAAEATEARAPDGVARTSHQVRVAAAAGDVHRLLADLDEWPGVFPNFVHLAHLGTQGEVDRVGMWGLCGDRVDHWVALRRVDESALRVEFQPEAAEPPLASMRRVWTCTPVSDRECVVRLDHEYLLRDAQEKSADETVRGTIETIAGAELSAVRSAAELRAGRPELLLTVADSVDIAAPPAQVYSALFQAASWPGSMDHVIRAEVTESGPHAHLLEMETLEARGGTFTTRTARVGQPDHTIAYRQLLLPALGRSHTVRWTLTPRPDGGTTVSSRQLVVIEESGVQAMLGADTDIQTAHGFIRTELSTKVRLVLDAVKNRLDTP